MTIPDFRVYQTAPTSSQRTQTAPTSSQLTFLDLKKCANRSCKRTKISAKCAKALCAICCVMLLDACTYAAHDRKRAQEHAARTAQPKLHGPWSVMHPLPADIPDSNRVRPLPSQPLQFPANPTQPLSPPATQGPSSASFDPSQLDSQAAAPLEHRHRKEFQHEERKDSWTRQEADRRRREDAETLRRENIIAMKQSFRLAFWGNDADSSPLRTTIDYVLTWPTFALSQSPEVLALLNLAADDYIDTYVVGARYWETQKASKPFHLVTGQLVLFRRRGVGTCNGIDAVIDEALGEHTVHTPIPPTLSVTVVAPKPQHRAKRGLEHIDGHEERTTGIPRVSLAHLSPNTLASPSRTVSLASASPSRMASLSPSSSYGGISPSPSPIPHPLLLVSTGMSPGSFYLEPHRSQPSPSPQPFCLDPALSQPLSQLSPSQPSPRSPPSPSFPAPSFASPASVVNPTGLGLGAVDLSQSPIHMPPGARWPDEFYACDVAKGFYMLGRMITQARANGRKTAISKTAMFAQIYPGVRFSGSNVYANWKFWTECTEQERDDLAQTPRTPEGRWKQCRQALPAWTSRVR